MILFFLTHLVRIGVKIKKKSLQNICFIEMFLASLMEKMTKTEGNFENGKNLEKKEEDICFR